MSDSASTSNQDNFDQKALTALRLGALFLVIYWCYKLLVPFIPLILWGAILAVAVFPLHRALTVRLGNRIKLSATLVTVLGLIILTTPVVVLTESLVHSSTELATDIAEGSVHVPPPPERVEELPLVGEKLFSSWQLASENLGAALQKFQPQLKALKSSLLAMAGGAGAAFLQLFFSIIISGVFLATAKSCEEGVCRVMNWLVGERGPLLISLSESTIRSVARGVLGVAIIESILAAIGMVIAGVPAVGFWTFLILVLSTIQVPPLVVLIPMIVYVLSASEPFGAVIFIILSILIVLVDTFLKPILLGRTADAPMLVILMGAIGGMILAGIIGLFVGAVVLMLAWELLQFAMEQSGGPASESPASSQLPTEPGAP